MIESIKSGPSWQHRQALAHTLSQDLRLAGNGHVPIERLKRIEVPALAMAGTASPPWAASTMATLAGALPRASERLVDGQHHIPADPVVAAILLEFFR
jgi:pimeloyl-ACP methyl ester carboxylesterase